MTCNQELQSCEANPYLVASVSGPESALVWAEPHATPLANLCNSRSHGRCDPLTAFTNFVSPLQKRDYGSQISRSNGQPLALSIVYSVASC
jgi:hypothetical protein